MKILQNIWWDKTWNPIVGCTELSPACDHCWASGQAHVHYKKQLTEMRAGHIRWRGEVRTFPERLLWPLSWKKGKRIAVGLMGDLFHHEVPTAFIEQVFAIAALCPQHTFIILTKRAKRMFDWFNTQYRDCFVEGQAQKIYHDLTGEDPSEWLPVHFPMKNVWLGVTVESPEYLQRLDYLLRIPWGIHFMSGEPLLACLDVSPYLYFKDYCACPEPKPHDAQQIVQECHNQRRRPKLNWVICGGESGRRRREMKPEWALSLRDQCQAAGTAFFFKQWDGTQAADHLLEGRIWHEFPGEAA